METVSKEPQSHQGFFAVTPKTDCPHESSVRTEEAMFLINQASLKSPCKQCSTTQENWICLQCYSIGCSRYFGSHMVKHNEETKHSIALSFADGSFWCYDCDSYIHSKELGALAMHLGKIKFPDLVSKDKKEDDDSEMIKVTQMLKELTTEPKKKEEPEPFTKEKLVIGLKNGEYKKIVLLTGAGISVSAGIPDFRTPGTGLYDNLQSYKLPYPEAIFDIKYFKDKPEPFYKLAKELFKDTAKPTIAHYFIKVLSDEGVLLCNLTQNIDGLEITAGVDPEYVVEAHGHFRTAFCIKCKKEACIKEFMKHIQGDTIYKCECEGLVKPSIVFFGESMPVEFFEGLEKVDDADLVIIMGTSLKVSPFNLIADTISTKTPIVYINRENTRILRKKNFLFMEGDIDGQLEELIKELGWEDKVKNVRIKE